MLFVKESSKTIFFALLECEEDNYNSSNLYFKLMQIYNEFNVNNSINEKYSYVIKACKDKLEKYLFNGGMPSMNLFKSIRILDPLYFKLNDVNFDEFTNDFHDLRSCADEISKYKLICDNLRDSIDIIEFWRINKSNLPKLYELAKVYLHFPISTSSVERSFSKYNNILQSNRMSLKPETLRYLIFLYYNKNIDCFNQIEEYLNTDDDYLLLLLDDDDENMIL